MKKCTKCGKLKSTSEFYKRGDRKNCLRPECKNCHKKAMKKYNKKNYILFHERGIAKRYNLTLEQYADLKNEYNNKCAICGKTCKNKRLCVDHDHKTGKIRGMLCHLCNRGLGHFQDNPELLDKAINYLKKC
jgi:hypothetical protein